MSAGGASSALRRPLSIGLALVALTACGSAPDDSAAKANAAESQRVMSAVAELDGVTHATGGYQTRPEDAFEFLVFVNAADSATEADLDRMVDQSLRLVWQSRIHPLHGIAVHVTRKVGATNRGVRDVIHPLPQDHQQLEAKYGKRPVSDD